jgi:hypothetical protein
VILSSDAVQFQVKKDRSLICSYDEISSFEQVEKKDVVVHCIAGKEVKLRLKDDGLNFRYFLARNL